MANTLQYLKFDSHWLPSFQPQVEVHDICRYNMVKYHINLVPYSESQSQNIKFYLKTSIEIF